MYLIYTTKLELVICGKLNRIYYLNVHHIEKGKEMKNTQHHIFFFCLYLV